MASVVVNGDTSGAVTLSAPAVAGTVTVTLPASSGTMLTTASSTGISGSAISSGTVPEAYGGTGTSTGYYGFKSRIINGGMTIDQRNAGASVTPTNQQYTLDRWLGFVSGSAGAYSVAQSTTAPSGFYNSMLITSNANTTLGSTDYYVVAQRIEQNNLFDLGWGASGASSVTLSFKVYSSVAGTFNGYLYAYTATQQSYPFTYTVSSPNTWTSISVVIPGPTTGGLFSSPTSQGLVVGFTLGTGSSYATLSSPAWTSSFQAGLSGGSNFLATSGRVIYITGVQLEKGSTATSFDYRPYGTELALCQRYYYLLASGILKTIGLAGYYSSSVLTATTVFPVAMRTAPSLVQTTGTNYYGVYANSAFDSFDSFNDGIQGATPQTAGIDASSGISGTSGSVGRVVTNNASASIAFSAEL